MEERFVQPSHTYTPSTENSTSFSTPQRPTQLHQTSTPVTPVTLSESDNSYLNVSDVGSVATSPNDVLSPEMGGMKLGPGCRRPCKELIPPSMDDYPANASPEEQCKWKEAKYAAQWRYNMKTDPLKAGEYRAKENERSKDYYKKNVNKEVLDDTEKEERKKEQGRERYVIQ